MAAATHTAARKPHRSAATPPTTSNDQYLWMSLGVGA